MKLHRLPLTFKWIGLVLIALSGMLTLLFDRLNLRIEVPVFAVVSSFMETKFLVFSRTNFTDEISLLLALTGFLMVVFSKEKNDSEELQLIRYKSFAQAVFINTIFLIFCVLFVYGSSFMAMLVLNIFSVYVFYLIIFYLQRKRDKRKVS